MLSQQAASRLIRQRAARTWNPICNPPAVYTGKKPPFQCMIPLSARGRRQGFTSPAAARALNFSHLAGHDVLLPVDYAQRITKQWPGGVGGLGHDMLVPVDYAQPITRHWPGGIGETAADCKPHSAFSPFYKECDCLPGYKWNGPDFSACVPGTYKSFPDCKDAAGKKIPGCIMGYEIPKYAPFVAGGAFLGVILTAIVMAVAR